MREELVMSGFGGQGVLLIGRLLAEAAILEGLNITWIPSYEAIVRGGTVSCSIILSSQKIDSPVFPEPTSAIAMSQGSMDSLEPHIKSGGLLVINSCLLERKPARQDLRIVEVPANRIAEELRNVQLANMVALGAYLKATRAVSLDSMKKSLERVLARRDQRLISANEQALRKGFDLVT